MEVKDTVVAVDVEEVIGILYDVLILSVIT